MKTLLKITASLALLIFANYSYANAKVVQCPSLSDLKKTKLVTADKWASEWIMLSNPLTTNDGEQWSILVDMRSDISDASDALAYAQIKLKTEPLPEPTVKYDEHEHSTECRYGDQLREFIVAAINPAMPMTNSHSLRAQFR